jgi:RES domain-containing protein
MYLYRIAKTSRVKDLSGTGARIFGGRWNRKGTSVIYTAESRSLATVEYLVHVPLSLVPANLSMATFEVPDTTQVEILSMSDLPRTWRQYPAPQKLATMGTDWASGRRTLLLRVPSVVVAHESNILVNPDHPDIGTVRLVDVEKYRIDRRLLGKGRSSR